MTVATRPLTFPEVAFHELPGIMQWHQGEHCTIIAPTGQGKTTLVRELIPRVPAIREYVMVLVTKQRDKVLATFEQDGYKRMALPQEWARHVLVYPPFPKDSKAMKAAHAATFERAMMVAYVQHGWTVYLDEVRYVANDLGLKDDYTRLLLQGRALGITVIAATQRPRHIPLEAYDQPEHLFFGRDTDRGNIARIADISGNVDREAIMARVARLARYKFVYVNTREEIVVETTNGGG